MNCRRNKKTVDLCFGHLFTLTLKIQNMQTERRKNSVSIMYFNVIKLRYHKYTAFFISSRMHAEKLPIFFRRSYRSSLLSNRRMRVEPALKIPNCLWPTHTRRCAIGTATEYHLLRPDYSCIRDS